MKRLISIILTLCMLLGLMTAPAFAENAPLFLITDDSYGVTVYKTNVDYTTTTPHSNALAFAGYNSDYFMIREYSGTIDFHDYSVAAGSDYQSLQIDKGSNVTLRFYGENVFYGSLNGLSVYEGSNVIIDVAPNSSVTFYSTGDYDAI